MLPIYLWYGRLSPTRRLIVICQKCWEAGVYNKFLSQNIVGKLKRKYVLNTPGVNLNCCCTPGPIPIACQISSPNPKQSSFCETHDFHCHKRPRMSTGLSHFGWSHLFVWITEMLWTKHFDAWLPWKKTVIYQVRILSKMQKDAKKCIEQVLINV